MLMTILRVDKLGSVGGSRTASPATGAAQIVRVFVVHNQNVPSETSAAI